MIVFTDDLSHCHTQQDFPSSRMLCFLSGTFTFNETRNPFSFWGQFLQHTVDRAFLALAEATAWQKMEILENTTSYRRGTSALCCHRCRGALINQSTRPNLSHALKAPFWSERRWGMITDVWCGELLGSGNSPLYQERRGMMNWGKRCIEFFIQWIIKL